MALKRAHPNEGSRKGTTSPRPRKPASLTPMRDPRKRNLVIDAVSAAKVALVDEWGAVGGTGELAVEAHVDEIQAVPDGIFNEGKNGFAAIATVYLDLKSETFSSTDSVPAEVHGHFTPDGKAAIVDTLSVDTSALYA